MVQYIKCKVFVELRTLLAMEVNVWPRVVVVFHAMIFALDEYTELCINQCSLTTANTIQVRAKGMVTSNSLC